MIRAKRTSLFLLVGPTRFSMVFICMHYGVSMFGIQQPHVLITSARVDLDFEKVLERRLSAGYIN